MAQFKILENLKCREKTQLFFIAILINLEFHFSIHIRQVTPVPNGTQASL